MSENCDNNCGSCGEDCADRKEEKPVSYTHLDVYKRQGLQRRADYADMERRVRRHQPYQRLHAGKQNFDGRFDMDFMERAGKLQFVRFLWHTHGGGFHNARHLHEIRPVDH